MKRLATVSWQLTVANIQVVVRTVPAAGPYSEWEDPAMRADQAG